MSLSERSKLCLRWWVDALTCGLSCQPQPIYVATLGVTWGNGSGARAGGTFNLVSPRIITTTVTLDVWKGVWSSRVASSSSNWKEMRTLLQTLEHQQDSKGFRIKGHRLLYFTDTMVLYNVFRKAISKSTSL